MSGADRYPLTVRMGLMGVAAALCCVFLASPAAAQRSRQIEAMQEQMRALQRQVEEMQGALAAETERVRREQAGSEAAAAAARARPAAAEPGRVNFPGGRPTFTSADGNFTLGIYGRVQLDAGGYPDDQGADLNSGWNFRRARIGVIGRVHRDFTYSLIYDFGGTPDGTGSLYEASVGYIGLRPFNFQIGAFKPAFTLEDSISSADLLFLERPSIIEIARSVAAGTARLSAGVSTAGDRWFAGTYLTGPTVGVEADDEQLGGTLRLAYRPLVGDNYLLHVGASAATVFQPNQNAAGVAGVGRTTIQLRDRPELRLDGARFIDTGVLSYDGADVVGVELAGHYRNFSLQGEYYRIGVEQTRPRGVPSPDLAFDGFYAQGSWILTGESRGYNTARAAYTQPRIARPFGAEGGSGAWELVTRYSYVNLDDRDTAGRPVSATGGVRGGEQRIYGIGLNWYPNQNIRLMLNYLYGEIDRRNAAGTANIGQKFQAVALRTQFAF